jgi:hypothetical protein
MMTNGPAFRMLLGFSPVGDLWIACNTMIIAIEIVSFRPTFLSGAYLKKVFEVLTSVQCSAQE